MILEIIFWVSILAVGLLVYDFIKNSVYLHKNNIKHCMFFKCSYPHMIFLIVLFAFTVYMNIVTVNIGEADIKKYILIYIMIALHIYSCFYTITIDGIFIDKKKKILPIIWKVEKKSILIYSAKTDRLFLKIKHIKWNKDVVNFLKEFFPTKELKD